jgi:predicted O-methyltransferase YrrM
MINRASLRKGLKDRSKQLMFQVHRMGTRLGVHVLPVHFYSPVPNLVELEKTRATWARKSELPGIRVDLDEQAASLRSACLPYQDEYLKNELYWERVRQNNRPGYGFIESQVLYAVMRHYKPKRVLEVGSGLSTLLMDKASKVNQEQEGRGSSITSIDPYPAQRIRELEQISLIPQMVQTVPHERFEALEEGDFLFIDSSHTVKPGSDVNYLFLEVLPRLRPGVLVHVHDIYLPYDYAPYVLHTFLHWTETSLLRAFLTHNHRAEIYFCLSHLHYDRKEVLHELFPEYNPKENRDGLFDDTYDHFAEHFTRAARHFPSSIYFWIR